MSVFSLGYSRALELNNVPFRNISELSCGSQGANCYLLVVPGESPEEQGLVIRVGGKWFNVTGR